MIQMYKWWFGTTKFRENEEALAEHRDSRALMNKPVRRESIHRRPKRLAGWASWAEGPSLPTPGQPLYIQRLKRAGWLSGNYHARRGVGWGPWKKLRSPLKTHENASWVQIRKYTYWFYSEEKEGKYTYQMWLLPFRLKKGVSVWENKENRYINQDSYHPEWGLGLSIGYTTAQWTRIINRTKSFLDLDRLHFLNKISTKRSIKEACPSRFLGIEGARRSVRSKWLQSSCGTSIVLLRGDRLKN